LPTGAELGRALAERSVSWLLFVLNGAVLVIAVAGCAAAVRQPLADTIVIGVSIEVTFERRARPV